jgi:hypothetical protein
VVHRGAGGVRMAAVLEQRVARILF